MNHKVHQEHQEGRVLRVLCGLCSQFLWKNGPALIAFLLFTGSANAQEAPGPELYRKLSKAEAEARGIPPELADAVMKIESGYDPSAKGDAGEIGLMQVMPGTAALMDPAITPEKLADPATNIKLGVRYLADAYKLSGGDICTTVMKYRAGHGETRFSVKSVDYCNAARAYMASLGYTVTGTVPKAEFGLQTGGIASGGMIRFKGRTHIRFGGSSKCFARVIQPGKNFGRCIRKASLRAKGLVN